MLEATVYHTSGRQLRNRKQPTPTIRIEIVQPRRPHHPERLAQGSFDMREERGQVRQALTPAFDL
jgi:hypothetical protein